MIETSDPFTAGTPDVLRRVGPPAAPWPAGLVRTPTGPALLVDLDELSDAAFGPPAEHVLRPLDVFRTADGHVALLPALARPLAPGAQGIGASVTLAVSIIRGLGEAGAQARGRWWLTEAGTPVFVPVRDGDPAAPSAVALVRALAGPAPSDVFAELAVELERPEELDEVAVAQWEQRLFGLAAPAPVTASPVGEDVSRRRRRSEPAPGLVRSLLRSFDAPLAEAVSDAVTSLRRRARGLRGRRAPALIAAGTAAFIVLIVGLSWPEGDDRPRADTPSTVPAVQQSSAPSAAGPPSSAAHARPDPVEAARDLLTRLRSCDDLSCRAGVLEDPATVVPDGVALTAAGATLSVVDDLGGIAVVRADAAGERSQLIVMVARNDSWLVRDVYDAADQP